MYKILKSENVQLQFLLHLFKIDSKVFFTIWWLQITYILHVNMSWCVTTGSIQQQKAVLELLKGIADITG